MTEFYSPLGGGVRRYLTNKARWLAAHAQIEHVIVVPGPERRSDLFHGARLHVLAGPSVPASPGYHLLTAWGDLEEVLRREAPDIVEVGSPFLAAWGVRFARFVSNTVLAFYHSDLHGYYVEHALAHLPLSARRVLGSALDAYLRATFGRSALVIAPSRYAAARLEQAGIRRVAVAPHGVDLDTFSPRRRDPSWRSAQGLGNAVVLLYTGRLSTEKRLDAVLAALPALHARYGVVFVAIGAGHLRPKLQELERESPACVRVLPYASDSLELARIYASADLYVAPCPYETFGLGALEAMASGLGIVGANAGAVPELLAGGAFSRTFQPGDPGSLTQAVGALLALPRAEVAAAARSAAQAYSLDRSFGRLLELYRSRAPERRKTLEAR